MEVLDTNGGSSRVIEAVHSLDAERKDHGNVEDHHENENAEYTHPGGIGEIALTVVVGAKHRVTLTINICHIVGLYLKEATESE